MEVSRYGHLSVLSLRAYLRAKQVWPQVWALGLHQRRSDERRSEPAILSGPSS